MGQAAPCISRRKTQLHRTLKMVDIIVKDKLRASIEAASGGKQTVLYTAKGQPTYMNIIEKFDNSIYGAVDGMGASHTAFNYLTEGDLSRIFIGTYKGVVVNGELLSLPYTALDSANYSLKQMLNFAKACGKGFHLMTAREQIAAAYFGMTKGGKNIGNKNNGADASGHKGTMGGGDGTGYTLTGSGGYTWSHDNTITGIQDLSGGGWEYVNGLRIRGSELQILSNDVAYNYTDADTLLNSSWKAVDATTGALIEPTSSGTLDTTSYAATTPNSIRIVNDAENVGLNGIYFKAYEPFLITNFAFGSNITDAAKNQLKTYGVLPVSTLSTFNTAYIGIDQNNGYTERYAMAGGGIYFGEAGGLFSRVMRVGANGDDLGLKFGRPCYVEI